MTSFDCQLGNDALTLTIQNNPPLRLPFLWLRDNGPDAFHPVTRERKFDLLTLPADIRPDSAHTDTDAVIVHWPDLSAPVRYELKWLQQHAPGQARPDPSAVTPEAWSDTHEPVRFDATALSDDDNLYDMLQTLKRDGLIIVNGVEGPDGGYRIGDLIGFKRESNFGVTFQVFSRQIPNNQAYTSDILDLHTDLPNQQLVPGYQFLHCVVNSATGGDSMFADGFRVLDEMRHDLPNVYRILRDVDVPFRFRDDECDIRTRRAIIECDADERPVRLAWNPGILDVIDLPDDALDDWYAAYRALAERLKSHPCRLHLRLQAGEMAVFDNSRILHGRKGFDPSTGERRLHGFYIDRGEVDSRMRLIRNAHLE